MNALIRARYQKEQGIDPLEIVTKPSHSSNQAKLKPFLEWRT